MKSETQKRVLLWLVLVGVFLLLVLWKQSVIRAKRAREIVSIYVQWEERGRPVVTEKISRGDVKVYTKVTLNKTSQGLFEGYVSRSVWEKLIPGGEFYVETEGRKIFGRIEEVGEEMDVDTGMFRLEASLDQPLGPEKTRVIGYAHTATMKDVLSVPGEILDEEGGKIFLWKVIDGVVRRQEVLPGESNGYGTVILEGIAEGDEVVVKGYTQLKDNGKVDIVNPRDITGEKL